MNLFRSPVALILLLAVIIVVVALLLAVVAGIVIFVLRTARGDATDEGISPARAATAERGG